MRHKPRHTHEVRKMKTSLASHVTYVHRTVSRPTFDPLSSSLTSMASHLESTVWNERTVNEVTLSFALQSPTFQSATASVLRHDTGNLPALLWDGFVLEPGLMFAHAVLSFPDPRPGTMASRPSVGHANLAVDLDLLFSCYEY